MLDKLIDKKLCTIITITGIKLIYCYHRMQELKYNISAIVFEGGGVLGIGHIGALSEGSNHFDLSKVKYFAGTSVGSIVAALCACRIPIDKLNEAMNEIKFGKLLDDNFGIIRDMYSLFTNYGYYKGDELENTLGNILEKYIGNKDITLKEVHEIYGSYLIIPVTEMFKHYCKVKYFTPDSDPDEKLRTVVRYSSSYPFVFISKNNYSDGGILDNYPIKKLTEYVELENILGFKFKNDKDLTSRPGNIVDFAVAIISGMRKKANHLVEDELKHTILINTENYNSMDFDLTENDKIIIYNYGAKAAADFFQMD